MMSFPLGRRIERAWTRGNTEPLYTMNISTAHAYPQTTAAVKMQPAHAQLDLTKPKTQLNVSSHSAAAGQAASRSVSYLDTFMKITEEQSELIHRSGTELMQFSNG